MLAAAIGRRLLSSTRMAGPKVTLYVDTVSPFGYQAYWIMRASHCQISFILIRGFSCEAVSTRELT